MKYLIKGKLYDPIKVGDKGDWYEGEPDKTCGDCGRKYGEIHMEGCDVERCPACGRQMLSCDCGPIYNVEDDIDEQTLEELKIEQQKEQLRYEAVVEYDRNAPNGNIFAILGKARSALEKQQRLSDCNEMWQRVQNAENYNAALGIIDEYVLLLDMTKPKAQM